MRKGLLVLVACFLLLVGGGYMLLPAQQAVSNFTFVGAAQNSVYRCLSDERYVQKWWHDSSTTKPSATVLQQGDFTFRFTTRAVNVVVADITYGNTTLQSSMEVLALQTDSSAVEWKTALPPTNNLFKRVQHYFAARKLRNTMAVLMQRFQTFMQQDKNVYGLDVQPARVTDTMVVTTSTLTRTYPQVAEYYNLVQKLKTYIAANGAQETNYPMLNISELQDGYQARVAIPVNKVLPSSGAIAFKRLIPGNILIAEVSGGAITVEKSLQQLEYFVSEKGLRSPAIPFQSLVTDRMQEVDTTKWITRLYYPIY